MKGRQGRSLFGSRKVSAILCCPEDIEAGRFERIEARARRNLAAAEGWLGSGLTSPPR